LHTLIAEFSTVIASNIRLPTIISTACRCRYTPLHGTLMVRRLFDDDPLRFFTLMIFR